MTTTIQALNQNNSTVAFNWTQPVLGAILILFSLFAGASILTSDIFFRLITGLIMGYVLVRCSLGFAGSVNRAFRSGSTRLMIVLMGMFTGAAVINAGLMLNAQPGDYNMWVNPVNSGLIIGGLLFGFGMSFSSCCATGVLARFSTKAPLALVTLFFFGLGVFAGFPVQSKADWVRQTWFSSASYPNQGVYLPDLFAGGPLNGYLFAILLTALFAGIVIVLARKYEDKCRSNGSYTGTEQDGPLPGQHSVDEYQPFQLFSLNTYQTLFVTPWAMRTGALLIIMIFAVLMGATGDGWGASTPFGIWFGKLLMLGGYSASELAEFTGRPASLFTLPFFEHSISVQNLGIVMGSVVYLLMAGKFSPLQRMTPKEFVLFAIGGLTMGLGTRFANGCNVGALFTPIANLSLSGWVYFVFLVAGGILGNKAAKAVN